MAGSTNRTSRSGVMESSTGQAASLTTQMGLRKKDLRSAANNDCITI